MTNWTLSDEALKASEEAAGRDRARAKFADDGPELRDDGQTIVIPSPWYNQELIDALKAAGFHFEDSVFPKWVRDTRKPLNGTRYTPEQWLNWAIRRYSAAWPLWNK